MSNSQIILPVQGMTCTSCVASVERALNKVEGVANASVSLATGKANVVFDNGDVDILDLVQAVQECGFGIPIEKAVLPVGGMACISCVAHVEGAISDVVGVVDVNVNLSAEKAKVSFVHGVASLQDLQQAVTKTGYEVLDAAV